MTRKAPQHRVDQIRSLMSAERLQEFDEFCKHNRNTTAIRQLLEDWGYKVSQTAVQNWYRAFFPVGEEAKRFNILTSAFSGVDTGDALQKVLVLNADLIDSVMEVLKLKGGVGAIDPEKLLPVVSHLSREVRACAEAVNGQKYIRDRKALEMAGAYRAIQELRLIFADTPFESALVEATKGVLSRLEEE
ncbi:hypothetical protein Ava_D0016 [Trichormus variabilis ATCC 29413]|uniref:Uncharacterized protein n=2 Tax=Anabaena variabilis TaxID=264691 RepID=Q3M2V5_TRIV2|nr:hypothetical protein [Trichormus variabilis]ABA24681.1 hypothetical protein Ava_D0016 [Trichormus variabilis ATCC 29413]MBC1217718.1 hypothetical protein [Trichormus variabilis ARAD]MBC1258991.1 hypothetical protein [Trichormus variabilis V5]MBC1302702.1 hypothetical protein [Trichormus variabilis N2B]MBC1324557.1 hypothetical protein [Trichormus variabilis 9RC]